MSKTVTSITLFLHPRLLAEVEARADEIHFTPNEYILLAIRDALALTRDAEIEKEKTAPAPADDFSDRVLRSEADPNIPVEYPPYTPRVHLQRPKPYAEAKSQEGIGLCDYSGVTTTRDRESVTCKNCLRRMAKAQAECDGGQKCIKRGCPWHYKP